MNIFFYLRSRCPQENSIQFHKSIIDGHWWQNRWFFEVLKRLDIHPWWVICNIISLEAVEETRKWAKRPKTPKLQSTSSAKSSDTKDQERKLLTKTSSAPSSSISQGATSPLETRRAGSLSSRDSRPKKDSSLTTSLNFSPTSKNLTPSEVWKSKKK